MPDFPIKLCGETSEKFLLHNIKSFHKAIHWIHQLPYGRNTNRSDYFSIFEELHGTCSTKHAALAALAFEHKHEISLIMAICKLDHNTNKVMQEILQNLNVSYFPEAHCFIRYNTVDLDLTFPDKDTVPELSILQEYVINPNDIGDFKVSMHHSYIKSWMVSNKLSSKYSFTEILGFREQFIASLGSQYYA